MSRRKAFLSSYIRHDQHDALAELTSQHGIPKAQVIRYALDLVLGGTGWVRPSEEDRTPIPLAPGAAQGLVSVQVATRSHPAPAQRDTEPPGATDGVAAAPEKCRMGGTDA